MHVPQNVKKVVQCHYTLNLNADYDDVSSSLFTVSRLDDVAGTEPGVEAGQGRKNVLISGRSKNLFCSSKRPHCLWRSSFLHFKEKCKLILWR